MGGSSGKTRRELALEWQSTSKERSGPKLRDAAFNHRANFFHASRRGIAVPFFFGNETKKGLSLFLDKDRFRVTIAFETYL